MSELLSTPKQHVARTPKKFLKKGEGLKRFAAYKPPLPKVTAKKIRQAIVKFDLKNNYSDDKPCYLPDLLLDDSRNLSMEVPPIPPPKIVHTPMRPTRVQQTPSKQSRNVQRTPIKPPPKILNTPIREAPINRLNQNVNNNNNNSSKNNNIKENNNLINNTKKNAKNSKRYNLRSRRQEDEVEQPKQQEQQEQQQELQELQELQEQRATPDLSSPSPGNCILALAKQIKQVETTLNELKVKIENCNCGLEPVRPTRRAHATKKENQPRHPAPAAVSTPKILRHLVDDISQLKKSFDDLQVTR